MDASWDMIARAAAAVRDATLAGADARQIGSLLNENVWRRAQEHVGLQMGLLAYFEPRPHHTSERVLHYLSQATESPYSGHVEFPYCVERQGNWVVDDDWVPKALAFRLSREREKTKIGDPYFALALRFSAEPSCLSEAEHNNDLIYTPCGEMTAMIGAWLLHRIANRDLRCRLADPSKTSDWARTWKCQYEPDPIEEVLLECEHIQMVYRTPQSLAQWALLLGLVVSPLQPTPRLYHLVSWLRAYIEFLLDGKHRDGTFSQSMFGAPGGKEGQDGSLLHPDVVNTEVLTVLLQYEHDLRVCRKHFEVVDVIRTIAQLLVSRDEPGSLFAYRARFVLPGHYLLRMAEPFERAWIVLPVLYQKPETARPGERVGFFLGTFRTRKLPGAGIEDADYPPRIDLELRSLQIRLIKTLVQPVADFTSSTLYWPTVHRGFAQAEAAAGLLHIISHEYGVRLTDIDEELRKLHAAVDTFTGAEITHRLDRCLQLVQGFEGMTRSIAVAASPYSAKEPGTPNVREAVDLVRCVREALGHAAEVMSSQMASVSRDFSTKLPNQLQAKMPRGFGHVLTYIILFQLFRNAVTNRKRGSKIKIILGADEGGGWHLRVSNLRGDQSSNRHGTGTGLYAVRQLCALYDLRFEYTGAASTTKTWEASVYYEG